MTYPAAYSRAHDFTEEAGSATDHSEVNAELDNLGALLNLLNTNVQAIQRSDTKLANASVHVNALSTEALALIASSAFTVRGAWLTATVYALGDIVGQGGNTYLCAEPHTAGTFSTDLAAGKWLLLTEDGVTTAEAQTLIDDTLQGAGPLFAAAGGTADAMTATLSPTLTAYTDGMRLRIRAVGANTVTAPTINVDSLGARTITKLGGRALVAGDIDQAGHELDLVYRSSGSRFELTNPAVRVASATGHALVRAADAAAGRSAIAAAGTGVANTFTKRQTNPYSTIASATTLDLTGADGQTLYVTGSTAITAISSAGVGTQITLIFAGSLVLTHHATDLVLLTGANITTAAGDVAHFVEHASGDWRCTGYHRATGAPLVSGEAPGTIKMFGGFAAPSGFLFCSGSPVSRTTYSTLLDAITIQDAGDTTSGSAVVTNLADTSHMRAGHAIEGSGVPAATTILSVDSATQITLSANATATATGVAVRVFPHGAGDGSTTFNTPDYRDRTPVGVGDMGGSSAGRLSSNIADGVGKTFGDDEGAFNTNTVSFTASGVVLTAAQANGVVQPGVAVNFIIKT